MPQQPPATGILPERFRPAPDEPGSARDLLLDRPVALSSDSDGEALARHARLLARLEHAGVPAVHDLITAPGGSLLVQRRVDGVSLADAIAAAVAGMPPPELASPAATVQCMLKVCDTLSAAHAHGVVHRRVSPLGIVLGSYGQVLLSDWSGAQASEPTTKRPDGLHQDVRGVAACLLAALVRRLPGADGGEALLREAGHLPAPLLAIIRRALKSDAADGYADMPALAQDLGRWLEGQVPDAGSPGAACSALQRAARRLAIAALIVVALAAAGAVAFGDVLRERWAWGAPVLVQDFADPSWKNNWSLPSHRDVFTVKDGRLVSTAPRTAHITLKRRLTTPVAIEYTGEMLPGSEPCDLSLTWNEGSTSGIEDNMGPPKAVRSLGVQSGGYGNTAFFMLLSGNRLPVAYKAGKLENGRRYRFRVEIEDVRISLYVDGQLMLRHEDVVPFVSGRVGLYGHYPGKAFSDVRIYQKPPPPGISPLAVGDHFLLQREYAQALPLYDQVMQAHGDSGIGQQARFRIGLAQWRQERHVEALETWKTVSEPSLRARIEAFALQSEKNEWMHMGFAASFAQRYRQQDEQREALRRGWLMIVDRLAATTKPDAQLTDRILALRTELFPDDDLATYAAGGLLVAHGRFADAIERFPGNTNLVNSCRLAMGRSGEVLSGTAADIDARVKAQQMQGDFTAMLQTPIAIPMLRALAVCKLGRGGELLDDPDLRFPVLLHLGRAEELLTAERSDPRAINEALISLGRWAEAAGPGLPDCPGSGGSTTAKLLLEDTAAIEKSSPAIRWLKAVIAGEAGTMEKLRPQVALPTDLRYHDGWATAAILLPLIERLAGDATALERMRPQLELFSGIYGKRPWYMARALLGEIPPAGVLEMPAVTEREAWHALARGMCAELAGDAAAARTAYQEFGKLPLHQRLLALNTPDPEIEWFVRWRLRVLGG